MPLCLTLLTLHAQAEEQPPAQTASTETDALLKAAEEAMKSFAPTSTDNTPTGNTPTDNAAPALPAPNKTEINGYVLNRLTGSLSATSTPLSTRDQPSLLNLLEGNLQLKRPLWRGAFFYADASALLQIGGLFYETNSAGQRVRAPGHDVPQLRPQFVLSEAYLSYSPRPWINVTLGKKRVVWGPGFGFNPTDVINPARDPSDPGLQRAGAFVLKADFSRPETTLSLLASPQVLYQQSGLPYAMLKYPSYPSYEHTLAPQTFADTRDSALHYLLAARWYLLIEEADINLMLFYSNLYGDAFKDQVRIGMSFSRYFFTDYELHFEALVQPGSARLYAAPACVKSLSAAGQCALTQQPFYEQNRLTSGLNTKLLIGSRRVFADESQLSVEYLYLSDGYTPGELRDLLRGLSLAKQAAAAGVTLPSTFGAAMGGNMGNNSGLATRFSFDPLRRHYLFIGYSKPKIKDDWTIGAQIIAGLEDWSGVIIPSVSYNALEWLTLQLTGFIPIKSIKSGQVEAFGQRYSEYSLFPSDLRITIEAKAFY